MGEWREAAASVLRTEQEWLSALATIVIGDTSIRAGDRTEGGRRGMTIDMVGVVVSLD